MIENIIHINRKEFDRLSLLTYQEGYLTETFAIATQDKFPLHKIHYVFQNINPGETYEIDTSIEVNADSHVVRCVCYYKHKCIGMVSVTMGNYDAAAMDWENSFKVKAIQRGKEQWLKEIGLMISTTNMMIAYAMLNPDKVFVENSGKHHFANIPESDTDEIIYRKLKTYISVSYNKSKPSTKGVCPRHEFDVRGYMRHYKSGKVGFVKPYTKCKGRGRKIIHEYEVTNLNDESNLCRKT